MPLTHAGTPVPLRPQACELLAYLLRHRDRVVPKEELLAQVWPGQYVGDGVLHACVLAVRTALHDTGRTSALLHTVRGGAIGLWRRWRSATCRSTAPLQGRQPLRSAPAPLADVPLPSSAGSETPAAVAVAAEPHTAGEYKQVSVLCCGLTRRLRPWPPGWVQRGCITACRRWWGWPRRCCTSTPGPSCRRRVRASWPCSARRWPRRTMPGGR